VASNRAGTTLPGTLWRGIYTADDMTAAAGGNSTDDEGADNGWFKCFERAKGKGGFF
jgi:hypothetical protein